MRLEEFKSLDGFDQVEVIAQYCSDGLIQVRGIGDKDLTSPFKELVVKVQGECIVSRWPEMLEDLSGKKMIAVASSKTKKSQNAAELANDWIKSARRNALQRRGALA